MRLEVAVSSPLGFRLPGPRSLNRLREPPRTVSIEFGGREFVWHYLPPRDDPDYGYQDYGPSVTVVVVDDADRHAAAAALQRFLSALAFEYEAPIEPRSYAGTGGSGESHPLHPAGAVARRRYEWTALHDAPAAIELDADPRARLAVGLFREGLNAGSPFYAFLAMWNALDAVYDGDEARRDAFLRAEAPRVWARWSDSPQPVGDPALYLRESARNAIAHAIRDPGRPVIDPDLPDDRMRLDHDARRLREFARAAILATWPNVVRVTRRAEP